MVKIDKLNTKAKREILSKVANYIQTAADSEDTDEVNIALEVLVEYFLEPLSDEDYFGTEGWEKFFDI